MTDSARTALLIVNANSRRGQEANAYIDALEAGGMTLIRKECARREHVGQTIKAMRDEVDCVILAGGDGTMSSAAIALRDTKLPLGILPLGTGNDLARTLGLPEDPEQVAQVILEGRTKKIDVGSVNGQPFFNVASIGLTTEITERLNHATKKRFGRLAYPWTALRVVLNSQRFSAIIRCGDRIDRVRTMQITVGNGRFYGGGMVVSTEAEIDDHMLDIYSLEPSSKWQLLFMARAFSAGEHRDLDEVRTERSNVVEVVTKASRSVSADGEIVTVTPARFSVLPAAVTVYVPRHTLADEDSRDASAADRSEPADGSAA
jgi:YegS/Rv2252/BmrU family lipid kinase